MAPRWFWGAAAAAGLLALSVEVGPPARRVEAPAPGRTEWVVTLRAGADGVALAQELGLRVERSVPALAVCVVAGPADRGARLVGDRRVASVSPNLTFGVTADCCSAEPITRASEARGFAEARRAAQAVLGPLRARTPVRPGVVVAVLDTGCDAAHPDLAGALLPGRSLVAGGAWDQDRSGHGTAMASLVAARPGHGQHGLTGVAPSVELLPVQVADAAGRATLGDVAAGIVTAVDRGAQVILLSLGACRPAPALRAAIDYAEARGAVLVAAAGNRNVHLDLWPAADPRVVSVACARADGRPSLATALAPTTDLLLPGSNAAVALPRAGYAFVSGSSVAAARAAGLVATLAGLRPDLTPGTVRAWLRASRRSPVLFAGQPDLARGFPAGVPDPVALAAILDAPAGVVRLRDPRVLPARARPGDAVTCSVRLENHSLVAAPATTLTVEVAGQQVAQLDVPGLGAGEQTTVRARVTAPGAGQVRFRAGAAQAVTPLGAGAAPRALAISGLEAEATDAGGLTITATVEGRGQPEAATLSARLGALDLGRRPLGRLAAGETATARFAVAPAQVQALPEAIARARVRFEGRPADAQASDDAAALDLLPPHPHARPVTTQYQQNDGLNVICDAPWRLAPGRGYLPLLVFLAEKGDTDPNTVVEFDETTIRVRDTPTPSGSGQVVYQDERNGNTTAPLGLVLTDEDGQPVPDLRLFQHRQLDLPGHYTILRVPRAALGVAQAVPSARATKYVEVFVRVTNRRPFLGILSRTHQETFRWVLKVDFAAAPRPRLPGSGHYYDGHCHTITEWYQDSTFNLLAPKRNLCGPIPMLKEAAHALGLTDAVDAVRGRVITTDHNAGFNQGNSLRDRPPLGPSSLASSGLQREWDAFQQIFGISAGEEVTIHSLGPRSVGGFTVMTPGGVHMLTYRGEHVEGAYHGGSDLFRLLGDPWPDTKLEDVLRRLAKTNRSVNRHAAAYAAHPYGNNDWKAEQFELAFETDPARRVDLPVRAEGDGFVTKGVQLWNSDNKRRRMRSQNIDWNDVNPFADPRWQRGRDDWDERLNGDLASYHRDQVEPLLSYELAGRPGVRFPRKVLVLAGNDAHGDFNYATSRKATIITDPDSFDVSHRAFGRVATYAFGDMQSAPSAVERAFEAMLDGNSVLTDGPLASFSLDAEDRFDAADLRWHDRTRAHEDADGRLGGGGAFDGRGTALVRRGNPHARFGYRYTNTEEFGGPVKRLELYRTSAGDPNPAGTKPSGSPLFTPRGTLAASAADTDLSEAVDASEEGLVTTTTVYQLGAFTAADPATAGFDERRCYTNPIWAVPFDVQVTVARTETDAAGAGAIPPGALTVALSFDMSLAPRDYGLELKALDAQGDSSGAATTPIDTLAPVGANAGWSDRGQVKQAVWTLTNTQPIPLNLDRYPGGNDVTFALYTRDPLQDPFGNALHRVAFSTTQPGVGTGGGTGPGGPRTPPSTTPPPTTPPAGTAPVGSSTAPGATGTPPAAGGRRGGSSSCSLGTRPGAPVSAFGLGLLLLALGAARGWTRDRAVARAVGSLAV